MCNLCWTRLCWGMDRRWKRKRKWSKPRRLASEVARLELEEDACEGRDER